MTWQILLTISIIATSTSILLQRILLKENKSNPVAYSIVFQILTGVLVATYTLFRGFHLPTLYPILPNLVLMILLYGFGNVLIFKALKSGEASQFTILFATRSIWTIIPALIFLGEGFSLKQVFGAIIILIAVALVSWKGSGIRLNKSLLFSLAAAIAFGVAIANDSFLLRNFDVFSYTATAFIAPGIFIWAVNPKVTGSMKLLLHRGVAVKLIILAMIYGINAIAFYSAYQVGRNAAQIAALNQTVIVLTVLLAIIFLKERSGLWRKIAGAVLAVLGVISLI